MKQTQYYNMINLEIFLLGLHIKLGDRDSYYHDTIFLRDLFGSRKGASSKLCCYKDRGRRRFH